MYSKWQKKSAKQYLKGSLTSSRIPFFVHFYIRTNIFHLKKNSEVELNKKIGIKNFTL